MEAAALEGFPFLVDGLGVAVLGLLVPTSLSLPWRFTIQLGLLSALALFLAYRLLAHVSSLWFAGAGLRAPWQALGTALGYVVLVTGSVGLVCLASSAALRYQPTTQFLQLLSSLDIAWATSTVMVAVHWLWKRRILTLLAGAGVVVVCVWVIVRYIDKGAFGPRGAWRLRAGELWEYVLVYDVVVAALAIGLLVVAVRRRAAS